MQFSQANPTHLAGRISKIFMQRIPETSHQPILSMVQAHKTFGKLQWVAAAVCVLALLTAAHQLGSGWTLRKLVLPIAAVLAARAGLLARSFKQRLEFVDYRHPDH